MLASNSMAEARSDGELSITRQMLYRFVSPEGQLRADAQRLLGIKPQRLCSINQTTRRGGNCMTAIMLTPREIVAAAERRLSINQNPAAGGEF
ncbi:hypothetical protein ABIB80_007558 [Bradyrhizobium sp. i1.15.2]|uniref:hypothetical protein n=1 Tax=Bradyrhizobium sp. i1.15.2 TaxID=3156362 RepID=UPI003399E23F